MAKGSTGEVVSYEEACRRLLARLPSSGTRSPWIASQRANVIWPGHRMKAQGAAFAAGKILHRAQKDGLIRWTWPADSDRNGWVKA